MKICLKIHLDLKTPSLWIRTTESSSVGLFSERGGFTLHLAAQMDLPLHEIFIES